jgi:methionyl-tRNA formyltransferase
MTILKNQIPAASYALLASGANFSCEVLQALQQRHYLPRLLILPEYPPAAGIPPLEEVMPSTAPQRRLLQQAQDIEIGYAPAAQQAACAGLIERHAIDFLLVACWPYLIDSILIDSARKGALNMHPSLLPDFRGPDPLEQQLECEHSSFGVSLHLLNQYFDKGDIIAQAELGDFERPADCSCLEHYCALLGADLFIAAVTQYEQGWKPVRQPV